MEEVRAGKREMVKQFLEGLASLDFTLENITDGSKLEILLDRLDIPKAEETAYSRFKKYIQKRVVGKGEEFSFEKRKNVREAFRIRVYIDMFVKSALGYQGITGGDVVYYTRLAYLLTKRLKSKKPINWPEILEKSSDLWNGGRVPDPKVGRAIAMLTAKVFYQLKHGKYRLGTPTPYELFPEESGGFKKPLRAKRHSTRKKSEDQLSEAIV